MKRNWAVFSISGATGGPASNRERSAEQVRPGGSSVGRYLFATVSALAVLCGCAKKVDGDALYTANECRRVAIIDAATGVSIVGAEDLAYDATGERVFISAYDRRQVEGEVSKNAFEISQGGLYAAPVLALAGDGASFTLASIVARESIAGGLRPHGIDFDPDTREITFINRSYQRINGKWAMAAHIERADADGAVYVSNSGAARCSANDLVTFGDQTLVSFDHAHCGWRGGVEDIIGAPDSGIDTSGGADVFDGARHANGVTVTVGNQLALAATRDQALFILDSNGDGANLVRKIPLPGAPDNLTTTKDGAVVAALHPSLLAIGLQRRLGLGRSGSRIVRVDPETGATTLLFEDPAAKLYSAATVALEIGDMLVIGSVADRGLVVCKRSEAAT